MAVKKRAKTWAEISMIVVDFFTIFRLQLELCFPFYVFFFFFYLNIVLINYSPEYSVSPGAKRP